MRDGNRETEGKETERDPTGNRKSEAEIQRKTNLERGGGHILKQCRIEDDNNS